MRTRNSATETEKQDQGKRPTLHVQNFPTDLRSKIKAAASVHGETIPEYLIRVLSPVVQKDLQASVSD